MKRTYYIALNTYRELVRSKVLYSVLCFAALMVLASSLFGSVTIGDQVRVIKDFGLMSISLFSVAYAVISGSSLLHKELEKKTIYNILSKPVLRSEFVLGKYFGMLVTTSLMALLMATGLSAFAFLFEGSFDVLLFTATSYMILELVIVCAAALFFSSVVVTPMLAGIFTFCIFLAGRSVSYLHFFMTEGEEQGLVTYAMDALYLILPHLDQLNIMNDVVYGIQPEAGHFFWSLIYSASYAAVLLILASVMFQKREFN